MKKSRGDFTVMFYCYDLAHGKGKHQPFSTAAHSTTDLLLEYFDHFSNIKATDRHIPVYSYTETSVQETPRFPCPKS